MDDVLDEAVSQEDLKKFERIYSEQLKEGVIKENVQFQYGWCLIRSKYPVDIRKGIMIIQNLFDSQYSEKRDCLYYLAIGYARIKEFTTALKCTRSFLSIEPGNCQVQHLEELIKKKMEKDGLLGLSIMGSVLIGIIGIVSIIVGRK